MKKIILFIFSIIFIAAIFSSCRENTICLECTITIAGIEEDKGKTCGDPTTINNLEADYQEIVDRENLIVGMSASLECIKYVQP